MKTLHVSYVFPTRKCNREDEIMPAMNVSQKLIQVTSSSKKGRETGYTEENSKYKITNTDIFCIMQTHHKDLIR